MALNPNQLGMFIGVDCLIAIQQPYISKILSVHENGNIQVAHANGSQDYFEAKYIKPILRPLFTITDHEAEILFNAIKHPKEKWNGLDKASNKGFFYCFRDKNNIPFTSFYSAEIINVKQLDVFIKMRLDVFGWTKFGLAFNALFAKEQFNYQLPNIIIE